MPKGVFVRTKIFRRRCVKCKNEFDALTSNAIRCRTTECQRSRGRIYRRQLRLVDRVADNDRVRRWRESKSGRIAVLLASARQRAKNAGCTFSLEPKDIVIPEICPVLGIKLEHGTGATSPGSPSLDRIDPARGYVAGNVAVISHRANRLKGDATIVELEAIMAYMQRLQ